MLALKEKVQNITQDQAQDMGRYAAIKLIHDLIKEKMIIYESTVYESFKKAWFEETEKIIL